MSNKCGGGGKKHNTWRPDGGPRSLRVEPIDPLGREKLRSVFVWQAKRSRPRRAGRGAFEGDRRSSRVGRHGEISPSRRGLTRH